MKELLLIQQELKAPKNQTNTFGGYKYRSCEDILEAVKPLLKKHECTLVLSDEMVERGGRVYVQATACLKNAKGEQEIVTAYAREAETKKGMDDSQITGSSSSYARKYSLNGLFLIDDTKDADATNRHGKGENAGQETVSDDQIYDLECKIKDAGKTVEGFCKYYKIASIDQLPASKYNDAAAVLAKGKK